jgi:pimeloyl-ACP methyl ester carboxylesterase
MEKVTFQNPRGQNLVASFYPATSQAIVLMAHGFCSDRFSQGRFPLIAHHFNQKGIAALALDFSGSGESDDESLSVDKQVQDLHAALRFAKEKGFKKIAYFGNSLGAYICLKSYLPEICTIAMTGPLTGSLNYEWDNYFSPEQMTELNSNGVITEQELTNMVRKKITIDKQLLLDLKNIDQKTLLNKIECPVFFIHGDGDWEERALFAQTQQAIKHLSVPNKVKVLEGASHGFWGYMDVVAALLTEWYVEHLQISK